MKLYRLERKQRLPVGLDEAWEFFSSPHNLRHITPPWLNFRILSPAGQEPMYPGQIISYTIQPVTGVRIKWVTEITHVNRPHYFVDEQRFGPYRLWHHQHHFTQDGDGVLMTDIVHYVLPFSFIAPLFHKYFVRPRLEIIFDFRTNVLSGKWNT